MHCSYGLGIGAFAAALFLSACSSNESPLATTAAAPSTAAAPALLHPDKETTCPRRYRLGCVTVSPSGSVQTATFSCSGGSHCPVHMWLMYNTFQRVDGEPVSRDFAGRWDPNPYHSGPSTRTINFIKERRMLKPSNKVEYVEVLLACPAQSSCTGIGTVGIIPKL